MVPLDKVEGRALVVIPLLVHHLSDKRLGIAQKVCKQ